MPLLSIAENIFLGNEPARFGVIDWNVAFSRTRELLSKVGLKESPNALITNLGVGKQQLVEIAKALAKKVKLLILDEPTASLNESDSAALLDLLLEFKAQGITSILISHKLNETRQGRRLASRSCATARRSRRSTAAASRSAKAASSRAWSGARCRTAIRRATPTIGETLFEVRDWRVEHPQHAGRKVIKGVDLHVRRGEVVGIAGLMGAGRTELAMSIFGRAYGRNVTGKAFMEGREIDVSARSRRRSRTASPM